uniref:Mediator of RNA polymerase II transcription subunit 23 n=1 Tax=Glossina morsitans morsitans TaxID=37546 RepID=A0A1B0G5Z9_GLOMM
MNFSFESTALPLINGLGSAEIQPQFSRDFSEKSASSVASSECDELNRVLILILARSMHIICSGDEMQPWYEELLSTIMQNTPHSWTSHCWGCFSTILSEFFRQNNHLIENKQLLKKSVEEEHRNWTCMTNENGIINHFIRPMMLFLCLLLREYSEKFSPDDSASHPPSPVYFSNVCLRFLPVLVVVILRFIELPVQHVHQILEVILDHLSILYKFYDPPITYLYNTLHFYERMLKDRPSLKTKLVLLLVPFAIYAPQLVC